MLFNKYQDSQVQVRVQVPKSQVQVQVQVPSPQVQVRVQVPKSQVQLQVQVPGFLKLHINYSSKDDVKIVLSCKLTNQKENCCLEHKSVTKCCCTTLSDQS